LSDLADPTVVPTTVDAFLGGRLTAVQPIAGHHRAGLDAVLLAAAINPAFAGDVVDIGAGVGVAGMAVAARCGAAHVVLAERDETASSSAAAGLARPENRAFAGRVRAVTVDILDAAAREAAGLAPASADAVIMNPPFRDASAGTAPPVPARAAAYVLEGGIDPWFRAAASLLRPRGALAVIFDAARLDELLAACSQRFGGATIVPLAPRPAAAAIRVLVTARKGSRGPLRLLPPFVLHAPDGNAFIPAAEAVLRDGAALSAVHSSWTGIG
jgi:tRNA1(Val) A37 N6-methylase TrmN6